MAEKGAVVADEQTEPYQPSRRMEVGRVTAVKIAATCRNFAYGTTNVRSGTAGLLGDLVAPRRDELSVRPVATCRRHG
jgi:hypothetical protein